MFANHITMVTQQQLHCKARLSARRADLTLSVCHPHCSPLQPLHTQGIVQELLGGHSSCVPQHWAGPALYNSDSTLSLRPRPFHCLSPLLAPAAPTHSSAQTYSLARPVTACPHCSTLQPLHIQGLTQEPLGGHSSCVSQHRALYNSDSTLSLHVPALLLPVPTGRHCSPYTFKDSLKNPWVDTVLVFHDVGLDRLVNSYRDPALVDRAVTYVSCPNTRHVMDLDNITNSVVVTSGGSLTFQNMIMQVMTAGIYMSIYILYYLVDYLVYWVYTMVYFVAGGRVGGRQGGG